MVFYFKPRLAEKGYIIYMGLDKFENEDLIKYGLPHDVWFHVDDMSSAHVYVRMNVGEEIDSIPAEVIEDCAQLVKANSIQGNKVDRVNVVYTPWANLKKTPSMEVGQVGFHNNKLVKTVRVEKRINEIVNRLNKTKEERMPDLKAEREAFNDMLKRERRDAFRQQKKEELQQQQERQKEAELRSYKTIFEAADMKTNRDLAESGRSVAELEEDFM